MKKILPFAALAALAAAAACSETSRTPTDLIDRPAAAITVAPSPTGATVDTDKDDYAPGEVVTIIGTGWAEGERVHLNLTEDPVADGEHDWDVFADASGRFVDTSFAPGTQHLGVTFTLTATGAVSGTSTAVFTDGNVTGATAPAIFASNCSTAQTLFALGDVVCAKTTITVQSPPGGADGDFRFQWISPSATLEQETAATGVNGSTHQNTFVPNSGGVWTVRICKPTGNCAQGGNLLNSSTFTIVAPQSDNTPPTITPTVNGTLGNNGWYTSDVTVSWTVTDPESAISSSSGCGSTTINADTNGQTLTCTATSGGGTSSESVTIKRDATKPAASASASPGANGNGWNNSNVTVSFSGTDAMSGIASCDADVVLSSDGASQSAAGTCTDNAGNVSASASASGINIDMTAPSVSGSASPAANGNGWNNSDVTVSFTGTDGLSGIDDCSVDVVLTSEGAGQSASGTCTDKAGNVGNKTVSGINIDKTAPTATASRTPAANANGWNNSNVTVRFTGSDALSGIDSCSADVVLGTDGAGQSASGTCTDKAGNTSSMATASGINIDKTAPTGVNFVGGISDGASYYFGSVPAQPTCDADYTISGKVSCNVTGYVAAVGAHTLTATAKDKADNVGTSNLSYTVLAWTLTGFYSPVKMDALNTAKAGSTVPLKFQIFAGAAGNNEQTSTTAVKTFVVAEVNCQMATDLVGSEDPIDQYSTGGTTLRYDSTGGQFIQNWQTPKNGTGRCYRVTMTALDGSPLTALFKLK